MAMVYISYNHKDRDFVSSLADRLKALGHGLTMDVDSLTPGQDWRHTLTEGLKKSEVFVVVLSENAVHSQFVLSEIGAARAYAAESARMLLVPLVIDQIPVPPIIQDLYAIVDPARDVDHIAKAVDRAISAFLGRKAAQEEQEAKVARLIEAAAPKYIDDAVESLRALESRNRLMSNIWYVVGFLALVAGIVFGFYGVVTIGVTGQRSWVDFAILSLKSVIVISLLGACAKYGFTLGKTYATESQKSADRIHAISFGKFYLRIFGTTTTWAELKDVFQHWNIDRTSSFNSLDVSQFDPKILESLVELARMITGKVPEKK